MRIVHIGTNDTGGASNAACRLHLGLLKAGVDSYYLSLNKNRNFSNSFRFQGSNNATFFKRHLNKVGFFKPIAEKNSQLLSGLSGNFEVFTFAETDFDLSKHSLVKEADIVNLHWVGNFLNWPTFFQNVKKPIVWTLHDMNPFQGGFHYAEDVTRNKREFAQLEDKQRKIKHQSLQNNSNLTIITPSRWLKGESKKSNILGRFPHNLIPYGLDTSTFKPLDKSLARNVFNISDNKKMILFVSERVNNKRKGFDILRSALEFIKNRKDIVIGAVGDSQDLPDYPNLIKLNKVTDERLMPLLYSASDLFVLPSREDNLPNVVLESIACGTPVVGFNIGGVPDMIIPGMNGFLCEEISPAALAQTIEKALDHKFDKDKIRKDAVNRFDQSVQASRYIKLYESILNS